MVSSQNPQFHFVTERMNAVNSGPKYGDRMTNPAQILIFRLGESFSQFEFLGLGATRWNLRMLVEKEYVLDEHEPSTLRNRGKEPVQDPRRHKTIERCRCRTPDCCQEGENDEIE
jgi:hypothetical protein